MSTWDLGDQLRITGTFTNSTGTNINPSVVCFKVKTPAGTITTLTYGTDAALVRVSTGIYYVDVDANASGTWWVRFYSTGTGQAAEEDSFDVEPSQF